MKIRTKVISLLTACLLFISCKKNPVTNNPVVQTDSFTVTVNNGYGSGKFKTGDTVHIFSQNYADNQIFNKWSGDISLLNAADEWHTWFIMPGKNVRFTGSLENVIPFTLKYEQIKGRDRLKPVYYYFPAGHKGIVYLLHGTGGSAANLLADYEWKQFIKDLVNNNFGVIITEGEEATTGIDANGDGKIRWYLLPADTINNVDYANIRIITDTFYNRGITDRSKLKYSVGMSDGGFFSAALSYVFNFKAAVQYCAQGSANLAKTTSIPTLFCMARFDNNDEVGQEGNADALSFSNSMSARGVCSKYLIKERAPLYPERFARSGSVSTSQSQAIFNELKAKGYVDKRNYYIGYSDGLMNDFTNNP
ncbi:MAG TPA: hypothetical protein VLI68_09615, partial [Hanamia sp.]|nr:hypothetical protein [Hanamia sp.]